MILKIINPFLYLKRGNRVKAEDNKKMGLCQAGAHLKY
jgi:hypothetical protein